MAAFDAKTEGRLRQFATDLVNPVGRTPFERVARRYVGLFDDLRSQGLTWAQITTALHQQGITRENGKPLSAAQLSSVVSRQRSITDSKNDRTAPGKVHASGGESLNNPKPSGLSIPPRAVADRRNGEKRQALEPAQAPSAPMSRNKIKASLLHQKSIRDRLERDDA